MLLYYYSFEYEWFRLSNSTAQTCCLLFTTSHWPFGSLLVVKRLTQRPFGSVQKEKWYVKVVNLCKKNYLLASCFIYVHVIVLWGIYLAVFSMLRMRDQWQLTRTTVHFLRDRQARSNHKNQCNINVISRFKISVLCLCFAERLKKAGSWRNLYHRKVRFLFVQNVNLYL